MIEAYIVHDDIEELRDQIDDLANPSYKISREVFGEYFVALTDELIDECYD